MSEVPEARGSTWPAPVFKYAGGKTRLLPELLARAPRKILRYVEPFCGGAALYLALSAEGRIAASATLGDANEDLITAYRAIAEDHDGVAQRIARLDRDARATSRVHHYGVVRARWNAREEVSPQTRAADMLYLNRCCYNGLWRVNKKGEFNVPFGRYNDPLRAVPDLIRAAAPHLARAGLVAGDYRRVIRFALEESDCEDPLARPGDLVYLDPPYDGTFDSYTSSGAFDHEALADFAAQLRAKGVTVVASNADTPRVRAAWSGWTIEEVAPRCSIGGKGAKRGARKELLISCNL